MENSLRDLKVRAGMELIWIYMNCLTRRLDNNLVAIVLSNDDNSMYPTIKPGDIVIVDKNDCPPTKKLDRNGIYLVCGEGENRTSLIKRVAESRDHRSWILLSDNLDYAPIVLARDRYPDPFMGRIIASWTNHLK